MGRVRTIKDLAELAGVSAGTVSRALSDSGLISAATRDRVKSLADLHGFKPNALARNLRTQRTGAIGVIMPLRLASGERVSNPFFITMLGLLADALTERGYDLLLSRAIPEQPEWLEAMLASRRVDGVLLIGQQDQPAALDAVAAHYRQMVVWGSTFEGQQGCVVGSDNRKGGAIAARHLLERGCRHLAFVGDPEPVEMACRLAGLRDAAEQAPGVRVSVIADRDSFLAAFAAADHPDGVLCGSDAIAVNALVGFAKAGLKVPTDVKVVGYDGLAIGENVATRLTTIDQQIERGAQTLVDLLLRRIAGEDTASAVLEPLLVVRDST